MNEASEAPIPATASLVAAFGLGGNQNLCEVYGGEGNWRRFIGSIVAERLTGLAVAGLDANWLRIDPPEARELIDRQREAMLWTLKLERALLHVAAAFDASGITVIILKGPAVAHTVYPELEWRPFGDLDLLVRKGDWARARSVLEELGYRRRHPAPRPGFDERFGKAAVYRGVAGLEIDLHRTLAAGPFGLWIDPEALFEHTDQFIMGGRSLLRLDNSAMFLHACVHASLGHRPPLLLPLRDVAQIARADAIDWPVLREWATGWRLTAVIRDALERATAVFGIGVTEEASEFLSARTDRVERRALRAYTSARRTRGGPALSTIHAIPGFRSKTAYVGAMLFPSREFVAHRTGQLGFRSYVRRWSIPIRWVTRRQAAKVSGRQSDT